MILTLCNSASVYKEEKLTSDVVGASGDSRKWGLKDISLGLEERVKWARWPKW